LTSWPIATSARQLASVSVADDDEVVGVVNGRLGAERAALLRVLLDLGVLVVHLEADLVAAADHARPEAAGGGRDHFPGEDDGDVVRTAERELVAKHALEPGPGGCGWGEDARVGELELAQRELVAVAASEILLPERRGQQRLPATEEGPDVTSREPGADRGQRISISAGAEAVVELREGDPGLLGLALRASWPLRQSQTGQGQ
jgi:hypothetical protein